KAESDSTGNAQLLSAVGGRRGRERFLRLTIEAIGGGTNLNPVLADFSANQSPAERGCFPPPLLRGHFAGPRHHQTGGLQLNGKALAPDSDCGLRFANGECFRRLERARRTAQSRSRRTGHYRAPAGRGNLRPLQCRGNLREGLK